MIFPQLTVSNSAIKSRLSPIHMPAVPTKLLFPDTNNAVSRAEYQALFQSIASSRNSPKIILCGFIIHVVAAVIDPYPSGDIGGGTSLT